MHACFLCLNSKRAYVNAIKKGDSNFLLAIGQHKTGACLHEVASPKGGNMLQLRYRGCR